MKTAAAAVLVLALATAGTAAAGSTSGGSDVAPQAQGDFCATAAPTDVDSRIAAAVNALPVSVPTTPPIAMLDTGVGASVPELAGRLVAPFDATTGGTDGSDVAGHGSEVAGIAAGSPGLVQGVSPTSPVMPIRVYNLVNESSVPWIVGGINWAIQNHAAVISISSASVQADATNADVTALTRAIDDAFNQGILVVAAMGNDGNGAAEIPASLPHVIAVGASDLLGNRATFSNTGPWVDLVSPAASMVAPEPTVFCPSGYGVANGTSFAAPAVAGAAALLAQVRPDLNPQQRFDVLRKSARDLDPTGRDDETGYGMLDVQHAMTMPAPAVEASREPDDDPFYVRGVNAPGHPTLLTTSRRITILGELSPAKDPSDVYPVRLKKGERLTASAVVKGSPSLISLGLWKPTVGNFDVSNDVGKNEIVSTGGFSSTPALKMDAKKTATYFLSVEAPDAVDADDPTDEAPVSAQYKIVFSKTKTPKPKPKKRAHKKSVKKKR